MNPNCAMNPLLVTGRSFLTPLAHLSHEKVKAEISRAPPCSYKPALHQSQLSPCLTSSCTNTNLQPAGLKIANVTGQQFSSAWDTLTGQPVWSLSWSVTCFSLVEVWFCHTELLGQVHSCWKPTWNICQINNQKVHADLCFYHHGWEAKLHDFKKY